MMNVEKGIEIPEVNYTGNPKSKGAPLKYPFDKMEVGDSFLASGKKARSAQACAILYGKNHGIKFTSRKVDGGIRIWRIE